MGNGQASTLEAQAIALEQEDDAKALEEKKAVEAAIQLDWHHPTRSMEQHFQIVSDTPIGRGHFADVYLGQALNSGRDGLNLEEGQLVAVKYVYRARCSEENLHKEVDALLEIATRHHPNVVSLLDAFLTSDKLILVLEYCKGGELFEHLAGDGPYSEKDASEMVKQMAHVLRFLHSHNCTHRDLKPENILLENNGPNPVIKVADFGLATMKREPFMTSVCGTWAYCAPEVKKDRVYTKKVDVWSLGVITYILVSGFHPFDPMGDATEQQLQANIATGQFDFEDENFEYISSACKDLIVRMLVVDPAVRIDVDSILEHPWITHEASTKPLITAPSKLKPLVQSFNRKRKELGGVMHLMALSRMEHLALHHGLLTDDHIAEVHNLHNHHTAQDADGDKGQSKEASNASEKEDQQSEQTSTNNSEAENKEQEEKTSN